MYVSLPNVPPVETFLSVPGPDQTTPHTPDGRTMLGWVVCVFAYTVYGGLYLIVWCMGNLFINWFYCCTGGYEDVGLHTPEKSTPAYIAERYRRATF